MPVIDDISVSLKYGEILRNIEPLLNLYLNLLFVYLPLFALVAMTTKV